MPDASLPIYDSFDYPFEIQAEVLWNLVERGVIDEAQFTDIMSRLKDVQPSSARGSGRSIFDAVLADDEELVVEQLKAQPNCVNAKTSRKQWVPLHFAVADGNEKISRLLLAYGADPNQANAHGKTPLHIAMDRGTLGTIRALCEFGADLDVRYRGKTPRERAIERKFHEAVQLLEHLAENPLELRLELLVKSFET